MGDLVIDRDWHRALKDPDFEGWNTASPGLPRPRKLRVAAARECAATAMMEVCADPAFPSGKLPGWTRLSTSSAARRSSWP